jgi:hypothetical protein
MQENVEQRLVGATAEIYSGRSNLPQRPSKRCASPEPPLIVIKAWISKIKTE